MSREILVVTPENIEIEFELAGIGTRFIANILDFLFQIVAFIATVVIMAVAAIALSALMTWTRLINNTSSQHILNYIAALGVSIWMIAFFVVVWGYFIWYE